MRARYGVSVVILISNSHSATVIAVPYVISWKIGPLYNGTWLCMHIYSGSKNDMKSAIAVHYTYIYIVVCIIWINCIWLAAYVDYPANELWSDNGSIWTSAHLQLISDAWVATRQMARKPILWLLMIYVRSIFTYIQYIHMWGMYLCLVNGKWQKLLFGN